MENRKTDSDWRGGGKRIMGERRGKVKPKNMYKGPMDKVNGGEG